LKRRAWIVTLPELPATLVTLVADHGKLMRSGRDEMSTALRSRFVHKSMEFFCAASVDQRSTLL
jgi:hypothetical protein